MILTLVKNIDITNCEDAIVLQILNVQMKQSLAEKNLVDFGHRSKYFDVGEVDRHHIEGTIYKFWRGFYASIHRISGDLFLCVDVKTRVLHQRSVY